MEGSAVAHAGEQDAVCPCGRRADYLFAARTDVLVERHQVGHEKKRARQRNISFGELQALVNNVMHQAVLAMAVRVRNGFASGLLSADWASIDGSVMAPQAAAYDFVVQL